MEHRLLLRKSDFDRGDEDRGAPTFIENNRGEDVVEYRLLLKKSLVFRTTWSTWVPGSADHFRPSFRRTFRLIRR